MMTENECINIYLECLQVFNNSFNDVIEYKNNNGLLEFTDSRSGLLKAFPVIQCEIHETKEEK